MIADYYVFIDNGKNGNTAMTFTQQADAKAKYEEWFTLAREATNKDGGQRIVRMYARTILHEVCFRGEPADS